MSTSATDGPVSYDERALLRSAAVHSDDDTPRLVYADWLDENDQPDKARYIRLEVAVANNTIDAAVAAPEVAAILVAHRDEWDGPLRAAGATAVWYSRGLPTAVQIPASAALDPDRGGCLGVLAPTLHILHLQNAGTDDLAAIFGCPHLFNFDRLYGPGRPLTPDELRRMATNPGATRLKGLSLPWCGVGDDGAAILAGSPHLLHLGTLDLSHNGVGNAGLGALAQASALAGLETLTVTGNAIGERGYRALARSTALVGLRRVEVDHPHWFAQQVAIARARAAEARTAPPLPELEQINGQGLDTYLPTSPWRIHATRRREPHGRT